MELFASQSQILHLRGRWLSWYHARLPAFNAHYTCTDLLKGASITQLSYNFSNKLLTSISMNQEYLLQWLNQVLIHVLATILTCEIWKNMVNRLNAHTLRLTVPKIKYEPHWVTRRISHQTMQVIYLQIIHMYWPGLFISTSRPRRLPLCEYLQNNLYLSPQLLPAFYMPFHRSSTITDQF